MEIISYDINNIKNQLNVLKNTITDEFINLNDSLCQINLNDKFNEILYEIRQNKNKFSDFEIKLINQEKKFENQIEEQKNFYEEKIKSLFEKINDQQNELIQILFDIQNNKENNLKENLKKEHNKKIEEIKTKLEEEFKSKSKDLNKKIEEQLRPKIIAEISPKIEKEIALKLINENNKIFEFQETTNYDFVLQIDNIKNFIKGFKYYASKNFIPFFYDPNNNANKNKFEIAAIKKSFCKIGIIGDIKVGKTFLLQKVIKKKIDENFEDYNQLTKSLKLKLFKENYLFIEGMGFNMSYSYITNKEEKILIGQLNELFIKHFIYNVCDLVFIIVEELNQPEFERLCNLKYFFKGKKLIIVHNMRKLSKKEFVNYCEEISNGEFHVEKIKVINIEGKNDNFIYLENLRDEDDKKTVFIKEKNNNNNKMNQEIIHLILGNDNIDEIKKHNEKIFSYIIKQIETNCIQNLDTIEKFCFEKILRQNLNSFSKNYLLIKHIHTKGNDYSENSMSYYLKKEKNNIGLEIIKEENLIKYVIKHIEKDKVCVIPKNININFYTGGSILKDTFNIDNVTIYFDDEKFHILFYKHCFMETEKIKSTIQIKENLFEDSSEFITYLLKIEGEIKKIQKFDEKNSFFRNKFSDAEFTLNDINKYKRFEINMRFQHKSNKVINEKKSEIKEISDLKLIDIMYELIKNDDDFDNNSMSDIKEEDSNLSNSKNSEED